MLWPTVVLLCVRGKQHEVIEAVAPEIAVLAKIKIELCALGQPHFNVLFLKLYRPVLNNLVLREQANVGHGLHQLRLHAYNLKFIRRDPGAALEIDGVNQPRNLEIVNAIGTVVALAKVNQPCSLPPQIA